MSRPTGHIVVRQKSLPATQRPSHARWQHHFSLAIRGLVLLPSLAVILTGCDKPDPEPSPTTTKAVATPTPTTAPQDLADEATDKLRHKADKTIKSLTGFLHSSDPRLESRLQKLTGKLAHDKDGWRKKLEQKRDELRPQIDQLKEQVAKAEGKSKADVNKQLSVLEAQSHNAEKKLSELEGASGDAWKKIKAQLKEAEAKGEVTAEEADVSPAPTR